MQQNLSQITGRCETVNQPDNSDWHNKTILNQQSQLSKLAENVK